MRWRVQGGKHSFLNMAIKLKTRQRQTSKIHKTTQNVNPSYMTKLVLGFSLFLILSGLGTGLYQCSAPAVVSKHYLPSCQVEPNLYALSFVGDDFYYYRDTHIFKVNVLSGKQDSVQFFTDYSGGLNLIQTSQGVSMLGFDKRSQYDTILEKNVLMYNFNSSLHIVDTFVFRTIPRCYLLDGDFKFVSAYIDRVRGKVYLQDWLARLYTIECNSWPFHHEESASIDLTSGKIYSVEARSIDPKTECFLVSGQERMPMDQRFCMTSQFSVIQDRVVYYHEGKIYVQNGHSQAWNSIDSSPINPCRRTKNGAYSFSDGFLTIVNLR